MKQARDQIGRAQCHQVPVRLDLVAVFQCEAANRAVRFRIQDQEHRHAQLTDPQPLGVRKIRHARALQQQVDRPDERNTVLTKAQGFFRDDAHRDRQDSSRQTWDARASKQEHQDRHGKQQGRTVPCGMMARQFGDKTHDVTVRGMDADDGCELIQDDQDCQAEGKAA